MAFVTTADAARGRSFYEGTLGLTVKGSNPYAVIFDANGVELRMAIAGEVKPAPYTVLGWIVKDISGFVAALVARGVVFEKYDWLPQDAAGIWTSPDEAKVAWFKDPDGNLLSLAEL